jgi:hypothetical protein
MIPEDRRSPITIVMPDLFKNVLIALACILFVLLLFFGYILVKYRTGIYAYIHTYIYI